jgi:UDP-N-acetyl-D-glucosamine dehydrogenase
MSKTRLQELRDKIESREARIGVIGLGYVGLPLAIEFGKAGFRVTGIDVNADKIRTLKEGQSYIEDVPSEALQAVVEQGRFSATDDFVQLSSLDVINICVPTPLTRTKDPDVSHLVAALENIQRRLRSGQLIILGSTTYPGTTHELFIPMLEDTGLKVGEDFSLAFAPERIDPGSEWAVREVPKVVGGETPICTELAAKVFETIFDTVVRVSSSQSAEMVKLLENTFRAINIGLANEVALMCNRLDLDVWEVIEAASTKPYGFMKFLPGPGLGGHCIPVDPSYLAWKLKTLNFAARFIDLATEINSAMPEHVVQRVADLLNEDRLAANGARVLVLGVAYKKDVSDMRESPAIDVMRDLLARGADLAYHDPHVPEMEVEGRVHKSVELSDERLRTSDLVVIITDHTSVDYARVVREASRVFDTRNAAAGVTEGREKISKL